MRSRTIVGTLVVFVLGVLVVGVGRGEAIRKPLGGTASQLLGLEAPFAIGHRGAGENSPTHPAPIENTLSAVREAFSAGLSVIEVDVQTTLDGKAVVHHDDLLPDLTCVNHLTLAEIQARVPHIPTLQALLDEAKRFNQASGPLRGIVMVELKAPAPLCDRDDTRSRRLVPATVAAIRAAGMMEQVLFTSFSPTLLFHASLVAPRIPRILSINGLQFLTPEEAAKASHLEVTLIDKHPSFGLQWAELGDLFRLPGYRSTGELLWTALITRVSAVEADDQMLRAAGAPFVRLLHAFGFKVFGFTANDAAVWHALESLGVDGIYVNDVALGIELQTPVP